LLVIRDTHVGKGLFAKLRIPVKTFIGKIEGEIIKDKDYSSDYAMDLGDDYSLEPDQPFKYMNHSCEPNCELICDQETQEVWVEAIRTILPGDELCIDYGWAADGAIPCQCGARNCRGWIIDPDELHLMENVIADRMADEEAKFVAMPDPMSDPELAEESTSIPVDPLSIREPVSEPDTDWKAV
jgi:hypothetical protein